MPDTQNGPTDFASDWLSLRRDADERARAESTDALLRAIALPGGHRRGAALDVVDLGTGTGNNALYLIPRLAEAGVRRQRWILVDRSRDHLDEAIARIEAGAEEFRGEHGELELELRTCAVDMATEMDEVPMNGADLVTSSALLSHVSGHWVTDLSSRMENGRVGAALMTLCIDGHVRWSPEEPRFDEAMVAAFHGKMRQDQGFGPALGPDAVTAFGRAMVARGTTVQCFDASWILDDLDTELQERYLARMEASLSGADVDSAQVSEWMERRRRWIDVDESDLVVGHYDILALRAPV